MLRVVPTEIGNLLILYGIKLLETILDCQKCKDRFLLDFYRKKAEKAVRFLV